MNKTILNWSGGKDATLALHYLSQQKGINISALLTTINKSRRRITMHGVHIDLLHAQVNSLGMLGETVELPEEINMNKYLEIIEEASSKHHQNGITHYAYGDIFLEDLRTFRDTSLKKINLESIYPLWKRNTSELAIEFIELGYKAIVVAINSNKLDESFVGCEFDKEFLSRLPKNVDPCGENGEFHTFVYDGPLFNNPINLKIGETSIHEYTPSKEKEDCFCSEEDQKEWNSKFMFCELSLNS